MNASSVDLQLVFRQGEDDWFVRFGNRSEIDEASRSSTDQTSVAKLVDAINTSIRPRMADRSSAASAKSPFHPSTHISDRSKQLAAACSAARPATSQRSLRPDRHAEARGLRPSTWPMTERRPDAASPTCQRAGLRIA